MNNFHAPSIGLVELPALGEVLRQLGFRVISGGSFPEAASAVKTTIEAAQASADATGEAVSPFPTLIADVHRPGIKAWAQKLSRTSPVLILRTDADDYIVAEGARSLQLPSTIREILLTAGLTAPDDVRTDLRVDAKGMVSQSQTVSAPAPTPGVVSEAPSPVETVPVRPTWDAAATFGTPAVQHQAPAAPAAPVYQAPTAPAVYQTPAAPAAPVYQAPAAPAVYQAPAPSAPVAPTEPMVAPWAVAPTVEQPAADPIESVDLPDPDFTFERIPQTLFPDPEPEEVSGPVSARRHVNAPTLTDSPIPTLADDWDVSEATPGPPVPMVAGAWQNLPAPAAPTASASWDSVPPPRMNMPAPEQSYVAAGTELGPDSASGASVWEAAPAPAQVAPAWDDALTSPAAPSAPAWDTAPSAAPAWDAAPVYVPPVATPPAVPAWDAAPAHVAPAPPAAPAWDAAPAATAPTAPIAAAWGAAPAITMPLAPAVPAWDAAPPASAPVTSSPTEYVTPQTFDLPAASTYTPPVAVPSWQSAPQPPVAEPAAKPNHVPEYRDANLYENAAGSVSWAPEYVPEIVPNVGGAPVIFNWAYKGGVNKTSLSLQFAHRAADKGLRVWLVDMNRGQGGIRTMLRIADDAPVRSAFDAARYGDPAKAFVLPDEAQRHRGSQLEPLKFGVVLAPPRAEADPGQATYMVYRQIIDHARANGDLVIVDTQTIEATDTSGLINNVMLPMMVADSYGVGITEFGKESVDNLRFAYGMFAGRGLRRDRQMLVVTRVKTFTDVDAQGVDRKFHDFANFVGTTAHSEAIKDQLDRGRIVSDDPAVRPLLDVVLRNVTGDSRFDPVSYPDEPEKPRRRNMFGGGRK